VRESDLGLTDFVNLLFEKYDTDGNQNLDLDEFRVFLKSFLSEENSDITEEKVLNFFTEFDIDNSQSIDKKEIVPLLIEVGGADAIEMM
jgi:Ca2+-binding EF-hand superfamily protein